MARYRSGYKHQLVEDYVHDTSIVPEQDISLDFLALSKDGKLEIKNGYAWDGPSGPALDTKTFMRASLVHDALYQLMRLKFLSPDWRDEADELMRKICIEAGMWPVRAWYTYHAVRMFADKAADPQSAKEIITAP